MKRGHWTQWNEDGKIQEMITWRRGRKQGVFKLYNKNGDLTQRGKYRKDKWHGKMIYYADKKIISKDQVADTLGILQARFIEGNWTRPNLPRIELGYRIVVHRNYGTIRLTTLEKTKGMKGDIYTFPWREGDKISFCPETHHKTHRTGPRAAG